MAHATPPVVERQSARWADMEDEPTGGDDGWTYVTKGTPLGRSHVVVENEVLTVTNRFAILEPIRPHRQNACRPTAVQWFKCASDATHERSDLQTPPPTSRAS